MGAQPSGDVLAKIANALGVSSDYLMNGSTEDIANDTLNDKELLNQFKQIEQMPEKDKSVVKIFLDAFITKNKFKNWLRNLLLQNETYFLKATLENDGDTDGTTFQSVLLLC